MVAGGGGAGECTLKTIVLDFIPAPFLCYLGLAIKSASLTIHESGRESHPWELRKPWKVTSRLWANGESSL